MSLEVLLQKDFTGNHVQCSFTDNGFESVPEPKQWYSLLNILTQCAIQYQFVVLSLHRETSLWEDNIFSELLIRLCSTINSKCISLFIFLSLLLVFSIKFKHLICCLFMVSKQLQSLENLLSSESIFSSSNWSKGQRGTMESDRQPLCCDQDMAQVKSWGPANLETVHPTLSDSYMKGTEKIIKLIIRKVTITVHETFLTFTQPEK